MMTWGHRRRNNRMIADLEKSRAEQLAKMEAEIDARWDQFLVDLNKDSSC